MATGITWAGPRRRSQPTGWIHHLKSNRRTWRVQPATQWDPGSDRIQGRVQEPARAAAAGTVAIPVNSSSPSPTSTGRVAPASPSDDVTVVTSATCGHMIAQLRGPGWLRTGCTCVVVCGRCVASKRAAPRMQRVTHPVGTLSKPAVVVGISKRRTPCHRVVQTQPRPRPL